MGPPHAISPAASDPQQQRQHQQEHAVSIHARHSSSGLTGGINTCAWSPTAGRCGPDCAAAKPRGSLSPMLAHPPLSMPRGMAGCSRIPCSPGIACPLGLAPTPGASSPDKPWLWPLQQHRGGQGCGCTAQSATPTDASTEAMPLWQAQPKHASIAQSTYFASQRSAAQQAGWMGTQRMHAVQGAGCCAASALQAPHCFGQ